ncbi:MAG: hypothetical protein M1827_003524 [Pycnora praestabilis]|nr:MAG: hypothetical protein M1827_003524 [Pycnora praestabilis]
MRPSTLFSSLTLLTGAFAIAARGGSYKTAPTGTYTSYPSVTAVATTDDEAAIYQVLAKYPLAVDSKNFAALSDVFTSDVSANYGEGTVYSGLSDLEYGIAYSFNGTTTQHSLTTYSVQSISASAASTVQYFIATIFGTGAWQGQAAMAYGQFDDTWVKTNGSWLIDNRNLVYMGPFLGNVTVFAFERTGAGNGSSSS